MAYCAATRGFDTRHDRREIDTLEFVRFRWVGVWRSDEMDERHIRTKRTSKRRRIERIAADRCGAGRHAAHRRRPHKGGHGVSASHKRRDQRSADIAGSSGDEDIHSTESVAACVAVAYGQIA